MCREGPNCSSFVICRVFCDYEPIKHPPTMAKPKQTRGPHQMPLKGPGHGWILSVQSHFSGVCFDLKFSLCHLGVSHLFKIYFYMYVQQGPGQDHLAACIITWTKYPPRALIVAVCGAGLHVRHLSSIIHYPLAIHPLPSIIRRHKDVVSQTQVAAEYVQCSVL